MINNFKAKLVAPCGINCQICLGYLRPKNPCHGCRDVHLNKPKTRLNCKIRNCQKRTGKFCYSCSQFPCNRLIHLDKRYREKYGMSEIENLNYIKKNGINAFLSKEQKRWQGPKGILCVHDKKYYKN